MNTGSFDLTEIADGARIATTLIVSIVTGNEVSRIAHKVFKCDWHDRYGAAITCYFAAALLSAYTVGISLVKAFTIHALCAAILLPHKYLCGPWN